LYIIALVALVALTDKAGQLRRLRFVSDALRNDETRDVAPR
jgi:hypothetical protein